MLRIAKYALLISATVCLAVSCGGRKTTGNEEVQSVEPPRGLELLKAVPADAAAVLCFEKGSDALEMLLDSTDALRRCIPSRLAHSRMAVAWCYNGAVLPLLAVSAPSDTSSAILSLAREAAAGGISCRYLPSGPGGRGLVLLSRSESVVESSVRHIESNASILDAPGFAEALKLAPTAPAVFFWNNSVAGKWLHKDCLQEVFKRSDLVAFLKETAEWTVTTLPQPPSVTASDIFLSCPRGDGWYANFLERQAPGESRLAPVLPAGTSFVLSLMIADTGVFRESYTRYLDASVKLSRYNSTRSAFKRSTGDDPEQWEKEIAIREVARVHWDGREVLLARPAKAPVAFEPRLNRHQGYLGLLYGKAFTLPDESTVANLGRWFVIGSSIDVEAFASVVERLDVSRWPSRSARFIIYDAHGKDTAILAGYKQGIRLNVYKTK